MDRRSGEDVQSHHTGLDELLRSLLQVGALSDATLFEPVLDALGDGEIQTPEKASAQSGALGACRYTARPEALCPLVYAGGSRLDGKSRMNAHVQIPLF